MGEHHQLTDEEFMRIDVPEPTLRLETVTEAEARILALPYIQPPEGTTI